MRLIPGTVLNALMALVAGLVAVVVTAVVVPPAQAEGPTSLTLIGRGWGHGHGMSQYGAQNAAKNHARTTSQILDFYYPGTRPAAASGALVVLLTADTTSNLVVGHRSGLSVRSLTSGASWALTSSSARQWQLVPSADNRSTRLSVLTDKWRTVRDIPGEAEFRASGAAPIRVYYPGGSATYRGRVRSAIPDSGLGRDTVNVVGLEDYLKGVVPVEMPAAWHPQAVRTQAVAARTYAAFARSNRHPRHYHLCDTTACQVYRGVSAENPASDAAIAATATRIRTYDGKPAFTQFSSSNGGWSSAGSQPYLAAKQDPYDVWEGNPNASWDVVVPATTIEAAWPAIGDFERIGVTVRDGNGSWGGRVTEVRVRGAAGVVVVSGDTFRSRLGLKSTMFACPGGVAAC
ncbi:MULTISPECIES: SpoIID/LytB domain-containing protein [unclassified Nocardioides]|uniref:SpoIID/LytB domain-containing protein n=1 Tax=unclassified Nocardioides TaxID=2615069 RepID=UPI0006FD7D19|nr:MULTISPECIES: SpoIID/LytB domain-containing protein [unclassified Nocardioides]KRA31362.1 hypothetical protein ASD81_18150 [Nocardioides sp. Root614]KRA87983.1 hypothetical protein ASD84_18425 [Nocardioides sp. Root682]